MPIDPSTLSALLSNLRQILVAKYFFLGAYTTLVYDHIMTLPEEIQTVWKKKKTFPLYLFILVRYYTPLAVGVVAFAYFSTFMTRSRCARWMLFLPLGITMPLTILPGILMLIRVYALYNRNRLILFGLSTSLVLQTVAGLWQYTVSGATPAPDPLNDYEYHFCIYLPPKRIGHLSTMYIFWELGYDSVVFLLTIARTFYMHWRSQSVIMRSSLVNNLVQDGAFYFGCIFSVNLMWAVMILHAPTGLRAIAGIPSACVNTLMVCRITLNLRAAAYGPTTFERTQPGIPLTDLRCPRSPQSPSTTNSTGKKDLQVHVQTDFEHTQDRDSTVCYRN